MNSTICIVNEHFGHSIKQKSKIETIECSDVLQDNYFRSVKTANTLTVSSSCHATSDIEWICLRVPIQIWSSMYVCQNDLALKTTDSTPTGLRISSLPVLVFIQKTFCDFVIFTEYVVWCKLMERSVRSVSEEFSEDQKDPDNLWDLLYSAMTTFSVEMRILIMHIQ